MDNLREIQDLLRRTKLAIESDHNIDRGILAVLGYTWRGMGYWNKDHLWRGAPFFTGSVDAALALVRREYPGIRIILMSGYRGPYSCCTLRKDDSTSSSGGSMIGQVERPDDEMALAIVGAFLMAKEFQADNEENEVAS